MEFKKINHLLWNDLKPIYIIVLTLFLFGNCNTAQTQSNEQNQKSSSSNKHAPSGSVIDIKSFHDAAYNGDYEKVKYALDHGIQADVVDKDGQNALMFAAFNGHTEIVKLLIEKKVPVNAKANTGRTALMYASSGPFPQTVQLLIENNAELDVVDNVEHFTALMFAASEGQLEVVKILLKVGCKAKAIARYLRLQAGLLVILLLSQLELVNIQTKETIN